MTLNAFPNQFELPNERPKSVVRKKKAMKKDLMSWQLYTSKRFHVHGNMAWRIIIKDYQEMMTYEIEYSNLVKFRKHWNTLKYSSKESYIIVTITTQKGKPMTKDKEKAA